MQRGDGALQKTTAQAYTPLEVPTVLEMGDERHCLAVGLNSRLESETGPWSVEELGFFLKKLLNGCKQKTDENR